jgi:hypothetical protein
MSLLQASDLPFQSRQAKLRPLDRVERALETAHPPGQPGTFLFQANAELLEPTLVLWGNLLADGRGAYEPPTGVGHDVQTP